MRDTESSCARIRSRTVDSEDQFLMTQRELWERCFQGRIQQRRLSCWRALGVTGSGSVKA